jgi:hypothetical protein
MKAKKGPEIDELMAIKLFRNNYARDLVDREKACHIFYKRGDGNTKHPVFQVISLIDGGSICVYFWNRQTIAPFRIRR